MTRVTTEEAIGMAMRIQNDGVQEVMGLEQDQIGCNNKIIVNLCKFL